MEKDIVRNDLIHPIVLFEGKILDGRHRYHACLEAGVVPLTVLFNPRGRLQSSRRGELAAARLDASAAPRRRDQAHRHPAREGEGGC